MTAANESPKVNPGPLGPLKKSEWWHRKLEPEERQRVMKDLAIRKIEHWGFRFFVMLTLSAIVAVMGLLLNSAAVVIGAMLLAPLMQPVLATAACVSMALFKKSGEAFVKVFLATTWCIFIAFIFARILPDDVFTSEVLSRTGPDFKDLIVALAAGAAGAYATVREDASASLPGVAVAVALVPPLGVVGVTLQAGALDKAWGASLLYTTNLAAIILASVFVFVVTGFVPPKRLETNFVKLGLATTAIFVIVGLIGWPLIQASRGIAQDNRDELSALSVVEQWLSETDVIEDVDVNDDDGIIRVSLRGFGERPNREGLELLLRDQFVDKELRLEWVQVGVTDTTVEVVDNKKLAVVEKIVLSWLLTVKNSQLDDLELNGSDLRIDASGVGEPPSVDELVEALKKEFDSEFTTSLNWSQRQLIRSDAVIDESTIFEKSLRSIVASWINETDSTLVLDRFELAEGSLVLDFIGFNEPDGQVLIDQIADQVEEPLDVQVYFRERILLAESSIEDE